jgi:hypothetical protein
MMIMIIVTIICALILGGYDVIWSVLTGWIYKA